jgi:hypothetical protein
MPEHIIQGIDPIEVVEFIRQKNRKYQAMTLADIEEILGKDDPKYQKVRKVILDYFNNYERSILRLIFGTDFEGQFK